MVLSYKGNFQIFRNIKILYLKIFSRKSKSKLLHIEYLEFLESHQMEVLVPMSHWQK